MNKLTGMVGSLGSLFSKAPEISEDSTPKPCDDKTIEARKMFFIHAAEEIAKILCNGIYTTTDKKTGKNLKELFQDAISNKIIETLTSGETETVIRDAMVRPLKRYSEEIFDIAAADSDRMNSFTVSILTSLFDKNNQLIPRLLEQSRNSKKVGGAGITEVKLTPDDIMKNMAIKALEMIKNPSTIPVSTNPPIEGFRTELGVSEEGVSEEGVLEEGELGEEASNISIPKGQLGKTCTEYSTMNKLTSVLEQPPSQAVEAVTDINNSLTESADSISVLLRDHIDVEKIQALLDKGLTTFLKSMQYTMKQNLINNMVAAQRNIFLTPVIKIQILHSIFSADANREGTKKTLLLAKSIFRDALLETTDPAQIMDALDRQFVKRIAIDNDSGVFGLPAQFVSSLQKMGGKTLQKMDSKGRKTRARKNAGSRRKTRRYK